MWQNVQVCAGYNRKVDSKSAMPAKSEPYQSIKQLRQQTTGYSRSPRTSAGLQLL